MRLPRVATALVAGIGLALVGCVMQSILHNPMADASTLGVSPGAAFGAAFAIVVLGSGIQSPSDASVSVANPFTLSVCAFICSMIPTAVVLSLSRLQRVRPESMILTGVALSTLFSGGTAIIQYFATTTQLGSIVFWTFGSLTSTSMRDVSIMAVVAAVAAVYFFANRWNYTALLSGKSTAKALGVNTDLLIICSMMVCSLTAAVITAFIGILNFIGLIAPHIVRRIVGNDYRFLLPASGLAGGCLLLFSDLLSRIILSPQVLPIGAITSFVGAPVFIYLINRRNRRA
jgi:iron complex transport system permease protein